MLGLLRKNFLITRTYVLLLLAACAFMAVFLSQSFAGQEYGSTPALFICSLYVPFFCLMDLTRKDSECHSGVALLGAAPYSRAAMVISTYLYGLLLYGAAWLVVSVEAIFVPALRGVSPLAVSGIFLVLAVLMGVLLPLNYALGYERTRYIFAVVILVTPFLTAQLGSSTTLPAQLQITNPGLTALFWAAGSAVLVLSAFLSIKAFSQAELA